MAIIRFENLEVVKNDATLSCDDLVLVLNKSKES